MWVPADPCQAGADSWPSGPPTADGVARARSPSRGKCASSEVYLSEEYLAVVRKTQLLFPSIGSERKANVPIRLRFFDPGVCSRSGWAVSS